MTRGNFIFILIKMYKANKGVVVVVVVVDVSLGTLFLLMCFAENLQYIILVNVCAPLPLSVFFNYS